jgi:hypothetical protein
MKGRLDLGFPDRAAFFFAGMKFGQVNTSASEVLAGPLVEAVECLLQVF